MKRITKIVSAAAAALCMAVPVLAQSELAVTAYTSGFGLIRDTRTMALKKGTGSVDIQNVAATIDPTSVLFKVLSGPGEVNVLEQNYQFDLISPESILRKSTGIKLTFTKFDKDGKPHIESGVLISDGKSVVIKDSKGDIVLNPQGQISLSKMPEGLKSKPTLNWLLETSKAGSYKSQISYIAEGMNWKADYVALVNKNDDLLDLNGWISLTNNTGTSYNNARLTLIAGDVRRVQPPRPARGGAMMNYKSATMQVEEKSFFEYHMYSMKRKTSVMNNETKQLSLLGSTGVKLDKEMIFDGRGQWFQSWWYPGRSGDPGGGFDTRVGKVSVVLTFKNAKNNNLGIPLPKGIIRVYKEDDSGSRQFIGEDSIDHTPRDETVRLHIGEAFDVVGEYKRTNYNKIADNVIEESFEVTIRNHKDTKVMVKVVDHVWSDWKVLKSSVDYVKKDATTIEFPITIAANSNKTVSYTIRTTW